jgi:neutral ceramidase
MKKQTQTWLGNIRQARAGWMLAVAISVEIALAWSGGRPSARADSPEPVAGASSDVPSSNFKVGVAKREITPGRPVPMWGYGARHDRLSQGVLDPLWAKTLVIEAGQAKLAIVGMDLGRGPTPAMMNRIRRAIAPSGIANALICGSHSHHGPVIELTDQPGFGQGKFDDAVAYAKELPERIIAAILEADANRRPARLGVGARDLALNRNRHSRRAEKPTDPRMTVIRFDGQDGSLLAALVHYTAHPVLTATELLKFSADYPGSLQAKVEKELNVPCIFIQGAAGDQSANPPDGKRDPKSYGELLAEQALGLFRETATAVPRRPSLQAKTDHFEFATRVNFKSPITFLLYSQSFFPELIRNFFHEFERGVQTEVTTVVLNGELAIVGLSGEPFCQHSLRLRQRAHLPWVLVFGYCNGHQLYFPTIEAASEGGYGADSRVSPIALGAGEMMMDRALINIIRLLGKFSAEPAAGE